MLLPSIFRESGVEDFWRDPFRGFSGFRSENEWMKVDIKENAQAYEIVMNIPGAKKEDIQAQLKDGYLTVSATVMEEEEQGQNKEQYIRRERYYGSGTRSFYVGNRVQLEDIRARYENGILKLTIPKQETEPEAEKQQFISIEG